MQKYYLAVIGAGSGGYVAAIRAAQLGMHTVCIDNWCNRQGKASLGGTCLNAGCIPSKALLDSTHRYYHLKHGLDDHGIHLQGVDIDIAQMMARKDRIVASLTGGIATLFTKNKVSFIHGSARLLENTQIEVDSIDHDTEVIEAEHIIIATGSIPGTLPAAPIDGVRIIDSSGALEMEQVPRRLGIIGGGVIGLELGSMWSRLGAKVVLLIRRETFLPNIDQQLAQEAYNLFQEQGLDIRLGAVTLATKVTDKQVIVTYQDSSGEQKLHLDRLLVATGRRPNTKGLNAEAAGLETNAQGFIEVDQRCRTNLPGVYAIGDVVRGPMLAHKASEEGMAIVEYIAGQGGSGVNYDVMPWVIYTAPEIAWVGKTTEELISEGIAFRSGVFPFKGNGRAHAIDATQGMVKILSDAKYDRILGVHILGANASELVATAVTAMEFGASAEDIARTIHAHPTLSEALHEAALAVAGRAIHI